jgi:transposase-like protein
LCGRSAARLDRTLENGEQAMKDVCKKCGGEMLVYRTGPHPWRTGYEVQRFECTDCKAQAARTTAIERKAR